MRHIHMYVAINLQKTITIVEHDVILLGTIKSFGDKPFVQIGVLVSTSNREGWDICTYEIYSVFCLKCGLW